eukprot:10356483-Alexandrium_andersonii.AAC.1
MIGRRCPGAHATHAQQRMAWCRTLVHSCQKPASGATLRPRPQPPPHTRAARDTHDYIQT